MFEGVDETVAYVESQDGPYLTSAICVYEVLAGTLGRDETDVREERQRFGGVRALEFNEQLALEAAQLQDELLAAGRANGRSRSRDRGDGSLDRRPPRRR